MDGKINQWIEDEWMCGLYGSVDWSMDGKINRCIQGYAGENLTNGWMIDGWLCGCIGL